MQLEFRGVSYRYPGAPEEALRDISLTCPPGWTAIAGANGAGKSTLLQLVAGLIRPDSGSIARIGTALYCPQRTDDSPELLEALLVSPDRESRRLTGLLGLEEDWPGRWETLSHGERKKAQIAVALWTDPDLLAVDEPANHIDRDGRDLLVRALETFHGTGLIVSHDRDLIDRLCSRCVFLEDRTAQCFPGGYTSAMELRRSALEDAKKRRAAAREELVSAREVFHRRRSELEDRKKCLSKKGLGWRDHDAKSRVDGLRMGGKAEGSARRMRAAASRVRAAEEKLAGSTVRKERELSFWLEGSRSMRNSLLEIPSERLPLGRRELRFPALGIGPDDRIALTGRNGSGKSTLVRHLAARLEMCSGGFLYMPQELGDVAGELLAEMASLDSSELGEVMSIVSCLGSDPAALLDSGQPSPGELRKLMLALSARKSPAVLILDEPTNHLDLPSIELLESSLASFPGAMLLVSHDRRFLEALADIWWIIEDGVLTPRR